MKIGNPIKDLNFNKKGRLARCQTNPQFSPLVSMLCRRCRELISFKLDWHASFKLWMKPSILMDLEILIDCQRRAVQLHSQKCHRLEKVVDFAGPDASCQQVVANLSTSSSLWTSDLLQRDICKLAASWWNNLHRACVQFATCSESV